MRLKRRKFWMNARIIWICASFVLMGIQRTQLIRVSMFGAIALYAMNDGLNKEHWG